MRPYDDFQVSTIEDLDPELTKGEGLGRKREFALGGFLLLLVLLWAASQVWTFEGQRESYRLGGEAAGMKQWEQAHSYFVVASGYKDADAQAAEVAATISRRDQYYREALNYAAKEDWPRSLRATLDLLAIEPGYGSKSNLTAIQAEARSHIYQDALLGTIALRIEADPPGLYYRAESRWVYLDGSDSDSRLLGFGPRSHAVYDVPGPAPGSENRRAMAAALGEKPSFVPLALNPGEYNSFVWGERGVWAFRDNGSAGGPGETPVQYAYFRGYSVDYQQYGSELTRTLALLDSGWSLLDLSPDGTRVLMADWHIAEENVVTISLYIADAAGDNTRLLYSQRGGFVGAQFSPDTRHILLTAYTRAYGAESQTALLLDTEGAGPPHVLEERFGYSTRLRDPGRGTFLRGGPFDGWAVLVGWSAYAEAIKVINPHDPDSEPITIWASYPSIFGLTTEYLGQQYAGALLYGQVNFGSAPEDADGYLGLLMLRPDGQSMINNIPLEARLSVRDLGARNYYLSYVTVEEFGEGETYAVYSVPVSRLDDDNIEPIHIYTGTLDGDYTAAGRPWNLGSDLLAYIEDGELHARTYDGDVDLTLETGVTTLYQLNEAHLRVLR